MEIFDRVHKTITCTPLAQQIIDTPEFQRLRRLKQLGASHFVFPCATHTRFEHSLGVAHLGRQMMHHLQHTQPELEITPRQVELVFLAGLCHDLGHGPYSHAFDELEAQRGRPSHEHRSCVLAKKITQGFISEEEQKVVCDMVRGDGDGFMYEIIANKRNGLDVDKLDYIVRDSTAIGWNVPIDIHRIIANTRVIGNHLTYNKKLHDDIFEVFRLRAPWGRVGRAADGPRPTRFRGNKSSRDRRRCRRHTRHAVDIQRPAAPNDTRDLNGLPPRGSLGVTQARPRRWDVLGCCDACHATYGGRVGMYTAVHDFINRFHSSSPVEDEGRLHLLRGDQTTHSSQEHTHLGGCCGLEVHRCLHRP